MGDATEFTEKGRRCTCREHDCYVPHDECACGCVRAVTGDATGSPRRDAGPAYDIGCLGRYRVPRTPEWAIGCIARRNTDFLAAWDLYSSFTSEHVGCLVFRDAGEYPTYVYGRTACTVATRDLNRIARAEV